MTVKICGGKGWLGHREALADAVADGVEADMDDLAVETSFEGICRIILSMRET